MKLFVSSVRVIHEPHAAGVLHGGLALTNVIVDSTGTPRLTDFGLNLAPEGKVLDDVAGPVDYFLMFPQPHLAARFALTAIVSRSMNRESPTPILFAAGHC